MARIFLLLLLLHLTQVFGSPAEQYAGYEEDPAITRFRKYIQIDTSKEENINRAVEFWRQQALELDLPFNVFTPAGLPICVITVLGSDPLLPSIMLNSHMDVVPAEESEWIYQPYLAYMDQEGDIYGRGSQDAKEISCQYVEVVRTLKKENVTLMRNLHITLMPDEETGGFRGMKPFLETEAFSALNVGFAIDEGMISSDDTLFVSYEDRRPWHMQVTVHGEGGHGSSIPDETAVNKALKFMTVVNNYREEIKEITSSLDALDFAGYISVNINMVQGGYRPNIIPSSFTMVVDMRLASDSNVTEMEELVASWVAEAGTGTELTFIRRDDVSEKTILDECNPYWVAMRDAVNEMGIELNPIVMPGTTDMLALRNWGVPAVGFSSVTNTTFRVHAKDEYLNADQFLRGINIYYEIIKKMGNVLDFDEENK